LLSLLALAAPTSALAMRCVVLPFRSRWTLPFARWSRPPPLGGRRSIPEYLSRGFADESRGTTEELTRTMVWGMRRSDLQRELEQRGIVIEDGKTRHDMLILLLNQLPSVRSKKHLNDGKHREEGGVMAQNGAPLPSSDFESIASNVCWANYDCEKLDLDPNKSYMVAMKGMIQKDLDGAGIGIVLRDENGTVVWVAQKFYPVSRSLFEAGYCAVVLAMRYVLSRFSLSNVVIQITDFTIYDQISGLFDTSKLSLQYMREEIFQLQREHSTEGKNVSFQVASKAQRLETEHLALQALIERTSRNMGDENASPNDSLYSSDPMKHILMTALPKSDPTTFGSRFAATAVDTVIDPLKEYLLRFDGGSRGNPGIAGAGMVLFNEQGQEIWHGRKYLGRSVSNNKAEYCAIHLGLNHARSLGIESIRCEGDSELIVKQLQGVYKVKSENLRLLWEKTQALMNSFRCCDVHHIERRLNSRADALANEGKSHLIRSTLV
jgi:ribonuclease HI